MKETTVMKKTRTAARRKTPKKRSTGPPKYSVEAYGQFIEHVKRREPMRQAAERGVGMDATIHPPTSTQHARKEGGCRAIYVYSPFIEDEYYAEVFIEAFKAELPRIHKWVQEHIAEDLEKARIAAARELKTLFAGTDLTGDNGNGC